MGVGDFTGSEAGGPDEDATDWETGGGAGAQPVAYSWGATVANVAGCSAGGSSASVARALLAPCCCGRKPDRLSLRRAARASAP